MSTAEKITAAKFNDVLAAADVLETFSRLSQADQDKFSDWIAKARDDESQWRRLDALVLALRIGPLEPLDRLRPAADAGSG